jgi:DNA-binding response OmpR family regulator
MSPEPAPPRELDGMTRVLMVAEERSYQHTLRRQLSRQGFAVDVAVDSMHARQLARQTPYDVVLLDLTATGNGGFELCREMDTEHGGPMVMMLAPPDGAEERLAGFEAGAADCVSKPVLGREIAARMRALARRRPASPGLQTAR